MNSYKCVSFNINIRGRGHFVLPVEVRRRRRKSRVAAVSNNSREQIRIITATGHGKKDAIFFPFNRSLQCDWCTLNMARDRHTYTRARRHHLSMVHDPHSHYLTSLSLVLTRTFFFSFSLSATAVQLII